MRPWSDMEKLIFLNGFFNRPKVGARARGDSQDFRYIASTLTNRSVQDVIDFYYLHKRGHVHEAAAARAAVPCGRTTTTTRGR